MGKEANVSLQAGGKLRKANIQVEAIEVHEDISLTSTGASLVNGCLWLLTLEFSIRPPDFV